MIWVDLRGRREQLECDVVGVTKRQTRAVARIDDVTVRDTELVETGRPLFELGAARATERDVIESRPALVEAFGADQIGEAVQAEHRVAQQIDDVAERTRVLVEDRSDAQKRRVA